MTRSKRKGQGVMPFPCLENTWKTGQWDATQSTRLDQASARCHVAVFEEVQDLLVPSPENLLKFPKLLH